MSLLSYPRKVLRLQYALAKLPVDVFEARVVSSWDPESDARIVFERIVGRADALAGIITGDRSLIRDGRSTETHADLHDIAADLDRRAEVLRAAASESLRDATADAEKRRKVAADRAEAEIDAAADDELQDELDAGSAAATQLEEAKERADEIAERRISAAEAERVAELDEVNRREERAGEEAAESLQKADEKARQAVDEREDADRLGS